MGKMQHSPYLSARIKWHRRYTNCINYKLCQGNQGTTRDYKEAFQITWYKKKKRKHREEKILVIINMEEI